MITRIVVSVALAAVAMHAQTGELVPVAQSQSASAAPQAGSSQPSPPKDPIPRHVAEPVVVRDGSLKIDIYSTSDTAVVTEKPDSVIANGDAANQATFLVPTRVVRVKKGPDGTAVGRLQTGSGLAHRSIAVRRYVYEIESLQKGRYVPYGSIVFTLEKTNWRIAPHGEYPLRLIGCSKPIALTGDWANHFQSTCEYGYGDLRLRLGSVTVEPEAGAPIKINLATGCSEFRMEPFTHPSHRMPFDHPPCDGLRPDPDRKYPKVDVRGVKKIKAIDVSLAK